MWVLGGPQTGCAATGLSLCVWLMWQRLCPQPWSHLSSLSLSWTDSAAMVLRAFGPSPPGLLQRCKILGSFCSLSRSPRAIPFCRGAKFWAPLNTQCHQGPFVLEDKAERPLCPFLPSENVTYWTWHEGRLFCAAHFVGWRVEKSQRRRPCGFVQTERPGQRLSGCKLLLQSRRGSFGDLYQTGNSTPLAPWVLEMLFSLCRKSPQRAKDCTNIESGPLNMLILKVQQNLEAGGRRGGLCSLSRWGMVGSQRFLHRS